MNAVARRRGRLPRRVYWFRRLLVLGVACALVFGIAQLLGSTRVGSPDRAARVAATPSNPGPASTGTAGSTGPDATGPGATGPDATGPASAGGSAGAAPTKRPKPLPAPDGPCEDSDVLVTPEARRPHAGEPVRVVLKVSTVRTPACTWEVSPESVFVTVTSEVGPIWSSQHCQDAVPTETVVARRKKADRVEMYWNGRESDPECSAVTPWVLSGGYTLSAVARGSVRPVETGFFLREALRPTTTITPTPTPTKDRRKRDRR
jgi:hypothetical protein